MIYQNEQLNEISFPLGGIGTGSIGLAGNGEFVDWEIFNRPNKGSLNPYTHFAIRAEYPDGRVDVRVLQGEHTGQLIGQYGQAKFNAYGFGPHGGTMCAFPHFRHVTFDGRFPVATLTFADDDFPAEVVMTAYNPMIPHEADDSSLPVAMFDIAVNSRIEGVRYSVVLSVNNPFAATVNEKTGEGEIASVTLRHAGLGESDRDYGDLTAAVGCREGALVQAYWYRSDWQQDFVETFWQELTRGVLYDRHYAEPGKPLRGRGDIASVGTSATARGETLTFSFALAWNVPNCYNYWDAYRDAEGKDITWKNYYATLFADSLASARYALENRERLVKGTLTFRDVLHGATLDPAVIDAAASNLSVLKTSTVLRLEDGTFYGWEGVHEREGSCQGTCTHVWSYAWALCLLYPELERSIRETEFKYDTDADGKMEFRTVLPLGRGVWGFRACLDGQMASVIKTYREWKLSGDDAWLRTHWATVKSLIGYAWSEKNPDRWDADRDGVLEGRQHHTLDMEMFGPSGWLEGMYLAALRATEEMARYLGDSALADECRELFERGYAYTKNELFGGEYFIQRVDLADRSYTESYDCPAYWNDEAGQLKYQIGDGCEIDQLLGQWHTTLCGLGDVFDKEQRRTALRSMMKYNFKPHMRDFINTWRVFAFGDEGGAVMCDYPPTVERPVIPIPYSTECMTGFEYAFAGLLIAEGMIDEGLTVVRAIRDRYDGKKRNPYNEIECGSNYARSMASFALLPIFSGFEFDLPRGHIGFSPRLDGDFRSLFSVGRAWGNYERTDGSVTLTVCGGEITLSSLRLGGIGRVRAVVCDGRTLAFEQHGDTLRFDACEVRDMLVASV